MNPDASQQIESRGRVYGGLKIPRFVQGQSKPQIGSAQDMNILVDALNSLGNMSIARGETDSVIITDSNTVLNLMPDFRELSVAGPGTRLAAYWTLDETTGTRVDKVQSIGMPWQTGLEPSPDTISGTYSNAVYFNNYNLDFRAISDPKLKYDGGGFCLFGWFNIITAGATFLGPQLDLTFADLSSVWIEAGNSSFNPQPLNIGYSDSSAVTDDIVITVPSYSAWHFYAITFDGSKVGFSIDNGAFTFFTGTHNYNNSPNASVRIHSVGAGGTGVQSAFDETGIIYGGIPTASELTEMFNSGAGVTWPTILSIIPT